MERYVEVYGDGKFENLVFSKSDKGGKSRGSVDTYNLLIDMLHEIKTKCRNKGI